VLRRFDAKQQLLRTQVVFSSPPLAVITSSHATPMTKLYAAHVRCSTALNEPAANGTERGQLAAGEMNAPLQAP